MEMKIELEILRPPPPPDWPISFPVKLTIGESIGHTRGLERIYLPEDPTMEKKAVISEETTPAEAPKPETTKDASVVIRTPTKRISPEEFARWIGAEEVSLDELDENHPTRRLIAGLPPVYSPQSPGC